jgi:hypothetical protein
MRKTNKGRGLRVKSVRIRKNKRIKEMSYSGAA